MTKVMNTMIEITNPPIIELRKGEQTLGGIYFSPNQYRGIQLSDEVLRKLVESYERQEEYSSGKYAEQD